MFAYSFWTKEQYFTGSYTGSNIVTSGQILNGLIAYYPFSDLNNLGNPSIGIFPLDTGSLFNPAHPTVPTGGIIGTAISIGFSAGAISTGYSGFLSSPSTLGSITGAGITFALWMNTVYSGAGVLADMYVGNGIGVAYNTIEPPYFQGYDISGTAFNISAQTMPNPNNWNFYAFTYDYNSQIFSIAVNDYYFSTGIIVNTMNNVTNELYLANNTAGANSAYDELGVWNRALSQSELAFLYNHGAGLTF